MKPDSLSFRCCRGCMVLLYLMSAQVMYGNRAELTVCGKTGCLLS